MRLLIWPLLMLLAGCWTGDRFYRASDARVAIPAGLYRSLDEREPVMVRVTIDADGMSRFTPDDATRPSRLGFAPLDAQGRRFVVWQAQESGHPIGDDIGQYSLLERRGDGEYVFFMPICELTASLAAAFGARLLPNDADPAECRFPNRERLEAALRQFTPPPDHAGARLVRVDED